jgi:hypothetical protein
VALAALALVRVSPARASETTDLVEGVVGRAEAIVSGRFEYRVTWTEGHPGEHNLLILSGPSWRVNHLDHRVERINHRGKYLEVHHNRQHDGSIRTSCRIEAPRGLQERLPMPPWFAGTPWYRQTVAYIKDHKAQARLTGGAEVDGIAAKVLEWDVPQADRYAAFYGISSRLNNGGKLRLYVAPQLGFVLPRIETVDPQGRVATRFDSTGFKEVGAGLFFPKQCGYRDFDENGVPDDKIHFNQYEILRVEKVNEAIPEEDFAVQLPAGTSVADERTPQTVYFDLGDITESMPDDLRDSLRLEKVPPPRTWRRAIVLGLAIGACALCVLVVVYAVRRRHRGRVSA